MTAANVKKEALAITGKAVNIPTGCKEVDTEFKCIRCADVSGGGEAAGDWVAKVWLRRWGRGLMLQPSGGRGDGR